MTTRVITLWRVCVISLATSVSAMYFHLELMLKAIKSRFKGSYDKQNLTLVVISYEIYETRRRLVSYISYEMITSVRSSINRTLDIYGSKVSTYLLNRPFRLPRSDSHPTWQKLR